MKKYEEFFANHASSIFKYDPETGHLYKLLAPRELFETDYAYATHVRRLPAGPCEYPKTNGYLYVQFKEMVVSAHRMAWFLQTGRWPKQIIDHLNGDPTDNRWLNLREASESDNRMNQRRRSDNTSGVTGVHFDRRTRSWLAVITAKGVSKHLGRFPDKERAITARKSAEKAMGFGPNHGAAQ